MRLFFAVFLLCFSHSTGSFAQRQLEPDCGGIYGLCGYKDSQTGERIIPRRFEKARHFQEGLALVREKGRHRYIDAKGDVVLNPDVDHAAGFHNGLAEVIVRGHAGVIDRSGRFVVDPQFARATALTPEVLVVKEGDFSPMGPPDLVYLANLGWAMDPFFQERFDDRLWGLYHIRTGWIVRPQFQMHAFNSQSRSLIWATATAKPNELWGLLDADGRWVLEPQFSNFLGYDGGLTVVERPVNLDPAAGVAGTLQGVVDEEGRLIAPLKEWRFGGWSNGFGLIEEDGKWMVVDDHANPISERRFDFARHHDRSGMVEVRLDGEWRGLDRQGRLVAHPDEGRVEHECPGQFKLVWKSRQLQVLGPDDKPRIDQYHEVGNSSPNCDRPFNIFMGKNKTAPIGFVGADGRLLFTMPHLDSWYPPRPSGHTVVRIGAKWGILDATGQFAVKLEYDLLRPMGGGPILARKDGIERWITDQGEERPKPVPPPEHRSWFLHCDERVRFFTRNGLWGLEDIEGREIIAPRFRAMECFVDGIAWAAIDEKRQWCPIDPDGSVRDRPACVDSRLGPVDPAYAREEFSPDPFEDCVLWKRAHLEYGAGLRTDRPNWIRNGRRVSVSTPVPQPHKP
jgi:WG containing repeat